MYTRATWSNRISPAHGMSERPGMAQALKASTGTRCGCRALPSLKTMR